jgi:malate synthase
MFRDRKVGHLMTNPAILPGPDRREIPEGILDAVVTTTIALHDPQGRLEPLLHAWRPRKKAEG